MALFGSLMVAQNTIPGQQSPTPGTDATNRSSYVLGPDDQISVWALGAPEISDRPMRIDPNGNIDLPLLGVVHAGGRTAEQLRAELTGRLRKYILEPHVTVSVADFRSQPVSVIGDVKQPGIHQIAGPRRLIEVLSLAGGLLPEAANRINITRSLEVGRVPLTTATDDPTGKFSVAEVSVKTLLDGSDPTENVFVFPHDVISVPRAAVIYVLGEVNKPGGFPVAERDGLSVLQAISMAGGVTHTAAPQRAEILHVVNGTPKRDRRPVNLSKILAGKSGDVSLQPNDILLVPNNLPKSAAIRAMEAGIQIGTGVLIWR